MSTTTRISAFLSVPAARTPPHKLQQAAVTDKQVLQLPVPGLQAFSTASINVVVSNKHARARASSSSSTPAVEEVEDEEQKTIEDSISESSSTSVRGCEACGKEEIERGCNGEGRIQGGIATVPGFGWWPIKAYRPCPSYLATGGRYRRTGQSMDEIGFGGGSGGGRRSSSASGDAENAQIRKLKKMGSESAVPRS